MADKSCGKGCDSFFLTLETRLPGRVEHSPWLLQSHWPRLSGRFDELAQPALSWRLLGFTVKGTAQEGSALSYPRNLRMRHQNQNSLHPLSTFYRTSFPKYLIGSNCRSQKVGYGTYTSYACFTDKDINLEELTDLPKVTELMPIKLGGSQTSWI